MSNYYISPLNDYLMHYGIKERSGRYDWGSGERPYQRLEKRKGFFARRKEEKQRKVILEQKKKELAEAQKAAEEKERLKAEKERVMREGTATEMKRYLPELSNQELQAACERIQWMKKLDSYVENEARAKAGKTTFEQVDSFMDKLAKVNKWGETSIKTYKNSKEILDMLKKASDKASKSENEKKAS